jgi:hypothetical protein
MTATSSAGDHHRVAFNVVSGSAGCQRTVRGSVPRTGHASRPSVCRNGHSPWPPMLPYSPREPSCADWRLAFPTGKIPPQIGGYLVGRRHGFVNRVTFCSCSNDTLLQEKAWLVILNKTFSLNASIPYPVLDTDDSSEGPPVVPSLIAAWPNPSGKARKVKRRPFIAIAPRMGSSEALNR